MFRGQNWLKNGKNGHFWGDFCVFGVKLSIFGVIFTIFLANLHFKDKVVASCIQKKIDGECWIASCVSLPE